MNIENGCPDNNLSLLGRWREVPHFPGDQTAFPDKETTQEQEARWEYAVSLAQSKLNTIVDWHQEAVGLGETADEFEEIQRRTTSDRIVGLRRQYKLSTEAGAIMRKICIPCFRAGLYTDWYPTPTGDL